MAGSEANNGAIKTQACYNSADQTGAAIEADSDLADAAERIRSRIAIIVKRHRTIYAQMGLMQVMRLNDTDFATVRDNPKAVKEFLGAHLHRLIDVQNANVTELTDELQLMMQELTGRKVSVDMWKLSSWDVPGSAQPQK